MNFLTKFYEDEVLKTIMIITGHNLKKFHSSYDNIIVDHTKNNNFKLIKIDFFKLFICFVNVKAVLAKVS
jgi:restriction endonuclease Mrr